jgi:hypothetical protein
MSLADATAALEGAIQSDGGTDAPAPVTPVEQAPLAPVTPQGETPATPVQPSQDRDPMGRFVAQTPAVDPTTPPDPAADTFDGGQFNPDTLAPELQDGWKQLQAAYTRKTQEVAAQRQQFEQFGDLNSVTQAVELYRTLQDPQALTQFHAELTKALEQQGYTPVQASAAAAQQIEQAVTPQGQGLTDQLAKLAQEYPDLAPLIEQGTQVSQLQARLDSFEAERNTRLESEQLAYQQMALAGELQRQEMAIRQSNPGYQQGDIDAVYELSAFFDGNLLQAEQRYKEIGNALLDRYLNTKQAPSGVAPVDGSSAISTQTEPLVDLDEALKGALAYAHESGITTIG